jgi:hypothetical protein
MIHLSMFYACEARGCAFLVCAFTVPAISVRLSTFAFHVHGSVFAVARSPPMAALMITSRLS